MRRKLIYILPVLLCFIFLFTLTSCGKDTVKIGTGGTGGNYYGYATNLKKQVEDETDYGLEVVSTQGSAANIRLLSEGYVDMALVQSDILSDALNGKGQFSEPLSGFHSVTGLYTETIQVVVKADSAINTIDDLSGKRVSIGEASSGSANNAKEILNAYNISSYTPSYLSYTDSAEALKNGTIDAFFVTASYPTTAIKDLGSGYKILSVDNTAVTRLLESNSAYQKVTIPANTYENQTEAIESVGVACVLIASDKLDSECEASILNVLKSHNEELQEVSFGVKVEEDKPRERFVLEINMYMTLAIAVGVLMLGMFLRKRVKFLEKFCIPAPVIGGLLFAIVALIFYATGLVEFKFDETLKNVCMMIFFTSVGYQANIKVLKKGGVKLLIFLACVTVLIFFQNLLSIGFSKLFNVSSLVGLCTGSISMVGGHGTSGAFGPVLEDLGLSGATTLCTTAATFGLILGSLMGGPVGRRLIVKHKLDEKNKDDIKDGEVEETLEEEEHKHKRFGSKYALAAYHIAVAMGVGTLISYLLSLTGMTFPGYIGAMIIAAIIRNVSEYSKKFEVPMGEINDIGGICLSLFLGIAMITLKLWQLADLALPLVGLLVAQTVFMFLFAYFVVFNVMGRNYDAAVLAAGTCGFGMGATPNAMANMQGVTEKYGPSIQAFLLVPIVGSMFADFINSLVVTLFINIV